MRCLAVLAMLMATTAAAQDATPLKIQGSSVIYLPETDEMTFRAEFNRPPEFPTDFLFFIFTDYSETWWNGIATRRVTLGGTALRDQGITKLIEWDVQSSGFPNNPVQLGVFDCTITGNVYTAKTPAALFGMQVVDMPYVAMAQDGHDRAVITQHLDTVRYAVPEPTTIAMVASMLFSFLSWKATRMWHRHRPAPLQCTSSPKCPA